MGEIFYSLENFKIAHHYFKLETSLLVHVLTDCVRARVMLFVASRTNL